MYRAGRPAPGAAVPAPGPAVPAPDPGIPGLTPSSPAAPAPTISLDSAAWMRPSPDAERPRLQSGAGEPRPAARRVGLRGLQHLRVRRLDRDARVCLPAGRHHRGELGGGAAARA